MCLVDIYDGRLCIQWCILLTDVTAVCILEGFQNQQSLLMADRVLRELGKAKADAAYKVGWSCHSVTVVVYFRYMLVLDTTVVVYYRYVLVLQLWWCISDTC